MADPMLGLEEVRGPEHDLPVPPRRWRLPALVTGAALVVVVVVFAAALASTREGGPPAMPRPPVLGPARVVYDGDLGDPFVLPVSADGRVVRFVAFGTGDWPARVPTATSSDLMTWKEGPDALPQLPPWAAPDERHSLSWAPAALDTGHGYVLYVSLPDGGTGQQCIGAAVSSVPEGPYAGVGDGPLLCQHDLGGSIDPAVTRDHAGRLHLLWKNDGNSADLPNSLWEQELTPDGLGLVGTAHRLLTSGQAWQGGIVEGPAVIPAADGGWWLFYSGNFFDRPDYATGLAYCPTIEGPCEEASEGPFLATADLGQERQFAPGGLETVVDADGVLWVVFDTWNRPPRDGRFRCCRSLQLAPVLSS